MTAQPRSSADATLAAAHEFFRPGEVNPEGSVLDLRARARA
jgi:hypothetical protein